MGNDLQARYARCPICHATGIAPHRRVDCRTHPNWHAPLPETMEWLRCGGCGHVFTAGYWTEAGLAEVFRNTLPSQAATVEAVPAQRPVWAEVVGRVARRLPRPEAIFEEHPTWLDVGCGGGHLVMTATEFGFDAVGLDLREEPVRRLGDLGYHARVGNLFDLKLDTPLAVLSFADVLEHMPFPVDALSAAADLVAPGGLLLVSCPNSESSEWRVRDLAGANPYWGELEHHHNFSRTLLAEMLRQTGFTPVEYAVSRRYVACMELLARRTPPAG